MNNDPREYTDFVDFTRFVHNWPVRGTLYTYMPADAIVNYVSCLLDAGVLEAFSLKVNGTFIPESVNIQLYCISFIGNKVDAALEQALILTAKLGFPIYWFEGDFSYKIDSTGKIKDKVQVEGGG